jgi:UDP-N-acetylmuramoyl-tripeptide--D-alanyl-D-alanine ligase
MFRVEELIEATGGYLLAGNGDLLIKGVSTDTRSLKDNEAFLCLRGENFDGHDFIKQAIKKGCRCVIAGKDISEYPRPVTFIRVKDTLRALGDIARFHRRRFDIPIIAVTGSNGKTTTKDMISWVLSAKYKVLKNEGTKNNHIGLPLSVISLDKSLDLAVLELGTNHFGEIEYLSGIAQANIGAITNIGPAHLEHFKDLKGVLREKLSLFEELKYPRIAFLNVDDPLLNRVCLRKSKEVTMFSVGIRRKADFNASCVKTKKARIDFLVNKKHSFSLETLGSFNVYNALIAIGMGRIFGLSYPQIKEKLANFNFPPSRLGLLDLNKVIFIDDTYNSNPASLRHALDALDNFATKGRRILVMGDMLELGSSKEKFHLRAAGQITKVCDAFIAVGSLSHLAAEKAKDLGFKKKNVFSCASSRHARDVLFRKLSCGADDIVLVKGSRAMQMEKIFSKTGTR